MCLTLTKRKLSWRIGRNKVSIFRLSTVKDVEKTDINSSSFYTCE
ncbi:MAG: hypothetical protein ACKPKO_49120 [Candidatus Fonsibacter sp.]